MIVTESNSNEQKTAKTSKGLLLISFNWQTQMSYKSESASISATFRIPNRSFLELTILRILKLQLLFPKGWRLSNIVIVSRKSTFCSEHDGTKNSTFNAYSKTRCALQEIYLLLCPLSVDNRIGQNINMKIVIYLCGTYFELAKEGEAQKTECEDVVFLYQVKMLQKHCVLQLQLLPEDGPHLVDQAEVWQDALLLVYLCT